jgi:hypothetical protein
MSADIYVKGAGVTRVDVTIPDEVDPAAAYRHVMRSRGTIGAMLRHSAMAKAQWDLIRAEADYCGWRRHKRVKHARDTLRRIRRMERERNGWR